jgi:hypothetical protein
MKIVSNRIIIPPLVRKSTTVCSSNIKIVVSPQNQKVSVLQDLNTSVRVNMPPVSIPAILPNQAVSRRSISQSLKTNKNEIRYDKPKVVKYITPDAPLETNSRLIRLRNVGVGRRLVVIGNGPSINEIPLELIKNVEDIDTFSINHPDPRVWPTTYWSFYDPSQLKRHRDFIDSYDETIFNSLAVRLNKSKSIAMKNLPGISFSRDITKGICIGRTSCYAAMQLGLWMNYDKIYFFGVDMDESGVNGQLHFYGQNPDVEPSVRKHRFKTETEYYNHASDFLEPQEKEKFYFCSSYNKWGFTRRFNYMDHKEAISSLLS